MKKEHIFLLATGILLIFLGIVSDKSDKENISKPSVSISSTKSVSSTKEAQKSVLGKTGIVVEKVLDGDTVITNSGEKIRYLGINTPEKGQPFANEATELNKSLVLNKEIKLEYDIQTKDRYGRTLAYVFVDQFNGSSHQTIFVNKEIVERGLAVSQTLQPNVKYQDEFVRAQEDARNKCLGIWKGLCQEESSSVLGSESNCIKIVSINADAPGDDNKNKNEEWIEIKSNCSDSTSMKDWLLKDSSASNQYRFKEFILDAGKNIIIYSGCGEDSKEKLYWECPERKYAVWNNSTDHAFLYNEKGELVSDYQY